MPEGQCQIYLNQQIKHKRIVQQRDKVRVINQGSYFGEISIIHNVETTATVVTS